MSSGNNDLVANNFFCRRIAKLCDAIVVVVGYRLAPGNKYLTAFYDEMKTLHWLEKQANLAECSKLMGSRARGVGVEFTKAKVQRHIVDAIGASVVEPWLAAHRDSSRFYFFFFPSLLSISFDIALLAFVLVTN
ncbi:hypothetical protein J1N35_020480 [Gossypium stocksii]|uniref:Alpha/beta hydrolase fold-3 domain-containing protein n=1 Tax=Gossypium stocksii TaxID=47602 RepID=A0A9D3VEX3_9ROSI|nr:hypothetical protein J1N35_020480 [Gossypium stocksii]